MNSEAHQNQVLTRVLLITLQRRGFRGNSPSTGAIVAGKHWYFQSLLPSVFFSLKRAVASQSQRAQRGSGLKRQPQRFPALVVRYCATSANSTVFATNHWLQLPLQDRNASAASPRWLLKLGRNHQEKHSIIDAPFLLSNSLERRLFRQLTFIVNVGMMLLHIRTVGTSYCRGV